MNSLVNSSKIKAILFDMDGVLIDARDWHYDALNKALEHFGFSIDYHSHLMTYDGLPSRKKLEMLTECRNFPLGLHQIVLDLKQKYTYRMAVNKCKPSFEHRQLLKKLSDSNIRLAVCSNSIKSTITSFLEFACIDKYFEFVLSNEDINEPKPSPEIYNLAISKLGLSKKNVLILEDSDHGLDAAYSSGAHVMQIN